MGNPSEECRVLLADDHPVMLLGLRALLEWEPGMRVVGEVGHALEVLPAIRRLDPDLLILDLVMPGLSPWELLDRLQREAPRTEVIALVPYSDHGRALEAMNLGARACVLKAAPPVEVLRAVRHVLAGELYLCPELQEALLATDPGVMDRAASLIASLKSGGESDPLRPPTGSDDPAAY